ncbi:hypothetical protein HKK52_32400 [Pseudomonas sp. ADAK2]|jgi:hypothetical protein|uniref:hypothetical protein n=1 Tax=unclassified Pseudomonas TaxID=196821 RepID=UPI001464588F|nr:MULTISPECIES: hypothetical protein [unclassified Pseudomonas]QJI45467.1 hypothetical protein HKK53_32400 [Pseudomonas sp. ADAK7]QJI51768.1 hypothetical protein HKK52_32400 [Pseudomonas sp. ADAK2]
MVRTSIYDRISEKRLAAEALARLQLQEAVDAPPAVIEPEPVEVVSLQLARNELTVAGLNLVMPQGLNFRDINTTLEKHGHPVTFSVKRRPAPEGLTLQRSVELYVENLRKNHSDVTIVRQSNRLLAGSPAIALDYVFTAGQERRHGRATSAVINSVDGNERQWFSISTMINPAHAELADWLIDFDAMLDAIAGN